MGVEELNEAKGGIRKLFHGEINYLRAKRFPFGDICNPKYCDYKQQH